MRDQVHTKALLIAVGENADLAISAINHYKPEHLLFFATQKGAGLIDPVIQPKIQQMPKRWDCAITPDGASFPECYRALAKQIKDLLPAWQVQPGELVIDYTGGTPSMVMALALAATDYSTLIVFSGPEAGKNATPSPQGGPGLVESNPWDQRAPAEAREAAAAFNQGRYTQARWVFSWLKDRVSGGSKPLYKAYCDLAEGYDLWDCFQYQKALEKIKPAKKALELSAVWGGPPGVNTLITAVGENLVFLEKLMMSDRRADRAVFLDLLASARRRAESLHQYEDAMIRLHRALEVLAQAQLEKAFGIKTQDVRPEQLPESLREDFRRCFASELDGRIKLPLVAAYNLLKVLEDPLGQTFFNQWEKMKLVLDVQHHSILAHGFEPIKPERYQQMFDLTLKLSDTRPEQLPRFPVLQF